MEANLVACYVQVRENAIVGNTNSISNQSKPNARKTGTLQLISPNGEVLGTYQFNNGGGGRGYLPGGEYTVTSKEPLASDDIAGMTVDGVGYKYRVHTSAGDERIPDPRYKTPRTGILIHPDGGYPGTNGCIGIVGDGSVQTDFMQKLDNLMQQNGGKYTFQFDTGSQQPQATADTKQPEKPLVKTNVSPIARNINLSQQSVQNTPVQQIQTSRPVATRQNTFNNFMQTRRQLSGRGY